MNYKMTMLKLEKLNSLRKFNLFHGLDTEEVESQIMDLEIAIRDLNTADFIELFRNAIFTNVHATVSDLLDTFYIVPSHVEVDIEVMKGDVEIIRIDCDDYIFIVEDGSCIVREYINK